MLIICKYDGETVTFSKSLKEILKYQYKYNYRFKLYDTQNNTPAYYINDDYFIEDEILTVSFAGFDIMYSSDGASYVPSSGGEGGEEDNEPVYLKIIEEWVDDNPVGYYIHTVIQYDIDTQEEITRDSQTLFNLLSNNISNIYLLSPHDIITSKALQVNVSAEEIRVVFNTPAYLYKLTNYEQLISVYNTSSYIDYYTDIHITKYEGEYYAGCSQANTMEDNGITPMCIFNLYSD